MLTKVPVTITEDHTYDLMQICDVCLAASGTATLETAMMELPNYFIVSSISNYIWHW